MKLFSRILVPLDGSAPSQAGLDAALALAKSQGGRLRLLHVVDDSALLRGGTEPAINIGDLLEMLRREGQRLLEQALKSARKRGVRAETSLHEAHLGRVADAILREAGKWRADVIVMGTHGRRGVARLVMGSDAETVLRESAVPVLLVKAPAARRRKR